MSETVLFLHPVGLDGRSSQWASLPPHLSPTMPGHGERRPARPGVELAELADEIFGWLPGPAHVIGQSMGGMIALHLALNYPNAVASMVLSCTGADNPQEVLEKRASDAETLGQEWIINDTLNRWFTAPALAEVPEPEPLRYARDCLSRVDKHALADTWRALSRHDVTDRLSEIACPVTCLAGALDLSTPPAVMRRLADGLPNSRYVEIDAPHMAHLERPSEFRQVVADHLNWVSMLSVPTN